MKYWSRGRLLMTRDVKKWSKEEQKKAHEKESQSVFSNFSSTDMGRARKQVCWVNPSHPEYEKNMELIRQAPLIRSDRDYFLAQLNTIRKYTFWQRLKFMFKGY